MYKRFIPCTPNKNATLIIKKLVKLLILFQIPLAFSFIHHSDPISTRQTTRDTKYGRHIFPHPLNILLFF